jgi:hypothetical protein
MNPTNPFVLALSYNNLPALQYFAKIMTQSVKIELEQFKTKNLSEVQMAEINLIVQNALYDILFNLANVEKSKTSLAILEKLSGQIQHDAVQLTLRELSVTILESMQGHTEIIFKLPFLNEQFALRNLVYVPAIATVRITNSFEFINVESQKRSSHRAKIANALKKEGYKYDEIINGYKKFS